MIAYIHAGAIIVYIHAVLEERGSHSFHHASSDLSRQTDGAGGAGGGGSIERAEKSTRRTSLLSRQERGGRDSLLASLGPAAVSKAVAG